MTLLLKEADICKLFELTRKLNARQEFARMAQMLIAEIFARVDADELQAELKK